LKNTWSTHERATESILYYLVDDDVRLSGLEEFKNRQFSLLENSKLDLQLKYIFCPETTKYDVFEFEEFSSGVYVSGQVKVAFKKNKIKVVGYAGNMYFQFMTLLNSCCCDDFVARHQHLCIR
jgi:hypothetical protein